MERAAISLWVSFFNLLLHFANTLLLPRQLTSNNPNPDFISIDCGASNDYLDLATGIWYQTDTNFVETGTNSKVSAASMSDLDYPYFGSQLKTLRSFPEGERHCYTLKPKQGKNNNYLIRAYFSYGNYDGKNQTPSFDLYLGVNYWKTIDPGKYYRVSEIIHTPTTNIIHVCLVKGLIGIPLISALELRPLFNSIYQTLLPSQSLLELQARMDVGKSNPAGRHSRYKDDIYDRLWYNGYDLQDWKLFNTSVHIDPSNTSDSYKLPEEVLRSAAQSLNVSYVLDYDYNSIWLDLEESFNYYVYFHFMEVEKLVLGRKRIINITLNNENILSQSLTLEYLKPTTISHQVNQSNIHFRISATSESDAPPILNAFEVYKLITPLSSPTHKTDVDAILEIKNTYNISKSDWQVDPCLIKSPWEGLGCTSGISARITSVNLSACKLTGPIAASFSQLTELESLDLSFNNLSGPLPEFLAELPKLRILNLTSNRLTGSVPKALQEKSDLQLSVDDNPGLCLADSCKTQKFLVPLVASISVLIVILLVSLVIWIFKKKKLKVMFRTSKKGRGVKGKEGSYSKSEIICITNNFENVIGKGGFGNVYLGTLNDGAQVAVKILSESSRQGFKEFQSEVELLELIHHRNLVRLVGYCDQEDMNALVYEYMSEGNLHQQLSDRNPNVLKWNERLRIAVDAASGLDYLHNGCKPPIVHRDLKPANILLNQNMQAKIADFGLSRAFENDSDTHILTFPAGTIGYLDPQLHISKKSDIYSFGIILFELITGKPAVTRICGKVSQIVEWVIPLIEKGDIQNIMDPRLQGNFNAASADKAIEVAMSCVSKDAVKRPDISHILAELKECLNLEIMIHENSSSVIEESLITQILARDSANYHSTSIFIHFPFSPFSSLESCPTSSVVRSSLLPMALPITAYFSYEIIHSPTSDTIHVCLVKGVMGMSFISALELRPLSNSTFIKHPHLLSEQLPVGQKRIISVSLYNTSNEVLSGSKTLDYL